MDFFYLKPTGKTGLIVDFRNEEVTINMRVL